MKEHSVLPDQYTVDLPDAPEFISSPPQYTASEMATICEKMLPYWNKVRFQRTVDFLPVEKFVLYEELFA